MIVDKRFLLNSLIALVYYDAEEPEFVYCKHHTPCWILTGGRKDKYFVKPGTESDCNDFGIPEINYITDEIEALRCIVRYLALGE